MGGRRPSRSWARGLPSLEVGIASKIRPMETQPRIMNMFIPGDPEKSADLLPDYFRDEEADESDLEDRSGN